MRKVLLLAMLLLGTTTAIFADDANRSKSTETNSNSVIHVHGPKRAPRIRRIVDVNYDDNNANLVFLSSVQNVVVYLYVDGMLADVYEAESVSQGDTVTLCGFSYGSEMTVSVLVDGNVVFSGSSLD